MGGMKAVDAVLRMVEGQAADTRVHVADTSWHGAEEMAPQELPETLDETLAMLERMAAGGRGLHSSTSQLNLSRLCHCDSTNPPHRSHTKCLCELKSGGV